MIEAPIVPQGSLSLLVTSFVYDYILLHFSIVINECIHHDYCNYYSSSYYYDQGYVHVCICVYI